MSLHRLPVGSPGRTSVGPENPGIPRNDETLAILPRIVSAQCHYQLMSTPTVEAAINDLMDRAWSAVYKMLSERSLIGHDLDVEEYTGLMSWAEGLTRYTVVHSTS